MSELFQTINDDGTAIKDSYIQAQKEKTSNNSLGKDAFLNLLVCQMQNQDPLNPNTDTEYIAQLATFSQVEEMQNIGKAMDNMRAMSSVGKYVDITVSTNKSDEDGVDIKRNVTGKVDYATSDNKISVNGSLYDYSDVKTVYNIDPKTIETLNSEQTEE